MCELPKSNRLTVNRGIVQDDGIPYLHFKYRGIPFTPASLVPACAYREPGPQWPHKIRENLSSLWETMSVSGLQCLIQRDVICAIMFNKALISMTKIACIGA